MKILLWSYVILYIHIIFHELGHLVCAKLIGLKIVSIKIGGLFMHVSLGILSISPVVGGGYVEIEQDSIEKKNKLEMLLFFMAGIIAEIVLIVFGYIFLSKLYAFFNFIVGTSMTLANCMPFIRESDVNNYIIMVKRTRNK